ncbi:HtaA domain-containing protein [Actinokineospora globicatena]|uniref:Uncharacterized protein n=1 Tax=Actinokineospora globicatena TaxID=103729 RepID=A0A9W6QHL1_9PSEU|nr:HtaA domain-containing protein [Actinokineospora globicatena]MCP2303291.1 hypothetical protein [Actinokineospora globicatena]GLW79579.1 hypothetical protein Aglo01_40600 [Actinokineospora globicatena]GLW86011.1 hypothetical protein Aglo02_36510 [Actinokineospora globicatena]GLW90191.1 hypothetical protein Aglo03_10070 [Actinokineospora globicatena]
MSTRYITWDEATDLFERRGLPKSVWENLYEGGYALHTGDAVVDGNFPLNSGEPAPWDEVEDWDIGYIVDGDLTITGGLYDVDDGAAALVVLGDLRMAGLHTTCDPKIVVTGDTTAEVVYGEYSDKYLVFQGDLRAAVQVWLSESEPDHIAGTASGSLTPATLNAAHVDNTATPLSELLTPELLTPEGDLDADAFQSRLLAGERLLLP